MDENFIEKADAWNNEDVVETRGWLTDERIKVWSRARAAEWDRIIGEAKEQYGELLMTC